MTNSYCWIEIAQDNGHIFEQAKRGDFVMTLTTECNMLFGYHNSHPIITLCNESGVALIHKHLATKITQILDSGTPDRPSLYWTDDICTGLYHPQSNVVAIATNGENRLSVKESGYVGVNTEDPRERLSVDGNAYISGYVSSSSLCTTDTIRIDANGNLSNISDIYYANQILPISSNTANLPSYSWSNNRTTGIYLHRENQMGLTASGNPIMYVGSNIGIGTDLPHSDSIVHVSGAPVFMEHNSSILVAEGDANGCFLRTGSNLGNKKLHVGGVGGVILQTYMGQHIWKDRFVLADNGNVNLFGTTTSGSNSAMAFECTDPGFRIRAIDLDKSLILNGASNIVMYPDPTETFKLTLTPNGLRFNDPGSVTRPTIGWDGSPNTGIFAQNDSIGIGIASNPVAYFVPDGLRITGSVNASGSKNFYIDHPLIEKTKLIHSCIEAPRHDLIYRGTTQLQGGYAMVDLDAECNKAGGMTKGTFESLTRDCQVFLQNNSTVSWDLVKGVIEKGNLIIVSNNPLSSAAIDWMVIAERNDPTIKMINPSTDGRLVTEVPTIFRHV